MTTNVNDTEAHPKVATRRASQRQEARATSTARNAGEASTEAVVSAGISHTAPARQKATEAAVAPLVGTVSAGSTLHKEDRLQPGERPSSCDWGLTLTEAAIIEAYRAGRRAEESWDDHDRSEAWELLHVMTARILSGKAAGELRADLDPLGFAREYTAGFACAQMINTYGDEQSDYRDARARGLSVDDYIAAERSSDSVVFRGRERGDQIIDLLTILARELGFISLDASGEVREDDTTQWTCEQIVDAFDKEVPDVNHSPSTCEGIALALFGEGSFDKTGAEMRAFQIARTYLAAPNNSGCQILMDAVAVVAQRLTAGTKSSSAPEAAA